MPVRLTLSFLAPIPVGHHVTAIALELRVSDSNFIPIKNRVVCDDDTRVVWAPHGVGAETMTYESLHFPPDSSFRASPTVPPLRGRVTSCVVWSDSGERIDNKTVLGIEPDPTGYR